MRQYRAVEGVRPAQPQPLGLDRQAGRCHETVPGRGGGEARPTSAAGPGPTGRPVYETVPGRGGGEARPTSAAGPGPTGRPVS